MSKKLISQNTLGYLLLIIFLLLGFLLRFIYLDKIPQGFNWDEASVGYNAYSLAKTGKDEFGRPWPVLIESFGDFKTGLYSMLLVPVIRLLGLTKFSVRLPNVFIGCLLILASFYLSLKIFKQALPASLTAGLIAISPWLIHASRHALEWYLGIPLMIMGIGLLLKFLESKKHYFILASALFLALSLYFYHSLRLFVPFLLVGFAIIYRKTLLKKKKFVLMGLIIGLLVLLPLLLAMKSNNWLARPTAVAIFTDETQQRIFTEGMYRHVFMKLPFVRVFNNKVVFYGKEVLDRYLAHFSPQFLFSGQDVTPRIGIEKVGKLYLASLPFLIIGLAQIIKKRGRLNKFLILWLMLAPLPSSLTVDAPHAWRSMLLIPIPQIITVAGLITVYEYLKNKSRLFFIAFISFTSLMYLVGFSYFLWRYFLFYPEDAAAVWQDGHQEMVEKLNEHKNDFENIIITTNYGQPHIFVAFFTPMNPEIYQKEIVKIGQQRIFNSRIPYLENIKFKAIQPADFCQSNTLIIAHSNQASKELPRLAIVRIANRFHQPEIAFEMFDTGEKLINERFCLENEEN